MGGRGLKWTAAFVLTTLLVPSAEAAGSSALESAGSELGTVTPGRLLDTRPGESTIDGRFAGTGRLSAGGVVEVQVAGRHGVPADAVGADVNVAAIAPSGPGYAAAYPCSATPPNASLLNYGTGETVANASTVRLSSTGSICIFTLQAADFIIDITGYFGVDRVSGDGGEVAAPSGAPEGRLVCPTPDTRIEYFFADGLNDENEAGFSEPMKAAVRRALATWEAAFELDFVEVFSQGEATTVFNFHPNGHFPSRTGALGFPIQGCHGGQYGEYRGDVHFNADPTYTLINWSNELRALEMYALHEIGHVLGFLYHFEEPGHVMSHDPTTTSLTQKDLDAFAGGYRLRSGIEPTPPLGSVSVEKGSNVTVDGCTSSHCAYVVARFAGFGAGEHTVRCYSSRFGNFHTYTTTRQSNTQGCVYGVPGDQVWVTIDGVESNRINWPSTATPPSPPTLPPPTSTPPTPSGSVSVEKGSNVTVDGCTSRHCAYMLVRFSGLGSGQHTVRCYSSRFGLWRTYTTSRQSTTQGCVYGYPGDQVWVTVDGVESNRINWPTTAAPTPPPPPPPTPSSSVSVEKGSNVTVDGCTSRHCAYMLVRFSGLGSGQHTVRCYSSRFGLWRTYTTSRQSTTQGCVYGYPGDQVWVTVDGVESNRINWPSS